LDDKIKRIEEILKKRGYKVTSQRKKIIEIFTGNINKHLKIEEIYDIVRVNISLPTVYRTIELLKKFGIIKEIIIDEARYYELKIFSEKCLHVHLKCLECGKIFDYDDQKLIIKLLDEKDEIEKRYDFIVNNISIIFNGLCKKCRR
jgi:Fur family ferric uptake transcriptional regulator